MATEPSEGAVAAAREIHAGIADYLGGYMPTLKWAEIIHRLAVAPVEAERDKLIGDRQECCIKIGCLETTNAALREHRDSLEAERDRLREAAQTASVALDDWIHSYAPEECGEPYVTETYKRIRNGGGTLAYIAEVQSELRTALGEEDGDGEG